jgi:hypothetical protein
MAILLAVHGGWQAGWAWKKMRPLMAANGHEFFTPTRTGLGERAHLAHPDINLETRLIYLAAARRTSGAAIQDEKSGKCGR